MAIVEKHIGLYVDHYELTMAQGFLLHGRKDTTACFDYFFRKNPFRGGYVIFAGLADLLDTIETLRFDDEDCAYLASIGFSSGFIDYLSGFAFRGDIHAPEEGEVVFPYEPVVRVEGNIIETQIIETILLNILNFESLVATKAARLRQAAGDRMLIDFGFRRAHGAGAVLASRAAVIGGVNSTSNVYSAFTYGLTSAGTQAHSWIEAHEDELTAFRNFARAFPKKCVLLADTFDTLRSGIPNAITVGLEMETRGERLFGVRLDSGDLAYLAKKARLMLDNSGLSYVKIMASNQLDEYLIRSLLQQDAPIDAFGVGTRLATGLPDAALDGVYKLSACDNRPKLKISESPEKIILPGYKHVFRCFDDSGKFLADCITLDDEDSVDVIFHPHHPDKSSRVGSYMKEPLFRKVMEKGRTVMERKKTQQIAAYASARLEQLPAEQKRFENPHVYRVGISRRLMDLRSGILDDIRTKFPLREKSMKALLVIDVQNDFCPGGALPASEGDRVVPVINRLMDTFTLVVASKDWHPEVTVHFDKWPKHCVQGTKGAEFHPDLKEEKINQVVLKGATDSEEGYSIFEGIDIDLERFLKDRGVDTLYLSGLVTEYCVKETALDALKRGFSTFVIRDAVKAVKQHEGDEQRAFEEMEKAGVKVISSVEVLESCKNSPDC